MEQRKWFESGSLSIVKMKVSSKNIFIMILILFASCIATDWLHLNCIKSFDFGRNNKSNILVHKKINICFIKFLLKIRNAI